MVADYPAPRWFWLPGLGPVYSPLQQNIVSHRYVRNGTRYLIYTVEIKFGQSMYSTTEVQSYLNSQYFDQETAMGKVYLTKISLWGTYRNRVLYRSNFAAIDRKMHITFSCTKMHTASNKHTVKLETGVSHLMRFQF
jgi:hypothetical protein